MKKILIMSIMLLLGAGFTWENAPLFMGDHTLRGYVMDEDGNPLIGAQVSVVGSRQAGITDHEGAFSLGWPDSCALLEVRYTGFMVSRQEVCAGKTARIYLQPEPVEAVEEMFMAAPVTSGRIQVRKNMAPAVSYSDYAPPFNTEDYALIRENRFYRTRQEPLSTFSIDVDAASYANLRRFLNQGQQPPKDAVRIEEMINYFSYDYEQPAGGEPFSVYTELSDCPWAPGHQLLHIGLQGRTVPEEELPASNLVFLIDVSGSMAAPNKLPLLKSSFRLLTQKLRPADRVAIVVYAGAAGLVLPPTEGSEKEKILQALDKLQAGGSTAGGAGIELAYQTAREHFIRGGNNRVILATDGDFNVGQSSDAELVRMIEKERESGVFLTVLGFGMGNYKDNKMQQLADSGNGNHAYIDNIQEARKVLVREFGGTLFTIAKDVKLQLEFNPAKVAGYRLVGYENRMLEHEDFNDDRKDAGELGSGHTVTALYELIPAGTESPFLSDVDDLKYQELQPAGNDQNEWLTLKLRYKEPDGNTSKKLTTTVRDSDRIKPVRTSDNFRWSAAVAGFGMLLRDSEYKGETGFAGILEWARSAKGDDPEGYRAEFIRLVETARDLGMKE